MFQARKRMLLPANKGNTVSGRGQAAPWKRQRGYCMAGNGIPSPRAPFATGGSFKLFTCHITLAATWSLILRIGPNAVSRSGLVAAAAGLFRHCRVKLSCICRHQDLQFPGLADYHCQCARRRQDRGQPGPPASVSSCSAGASINYFRRSKAVQGSQGKNTCCTATGNRLLWHR